MGARVAELVSPGRDVQVRSKFHALGFCTMCAVKLIRVKHYGNKNHINLYHKDLDYIDI